MAAPKIQDFSPDTIRLAEWAKALGHPARIAILRILIRKNACVCGTLVEELPLSQATVSQHLKVLKSAGLIQGNIDGPRICYCIHPPTWTELRTHFGSFFDSFSTSNTCC